MSDSSPATESTNEPSTDRGSTLIIAILVLSGFVVILNETVLSVALTSLMKHFGVPESTVQWVSTGFLLTMAVVIPATGYLLRRLPTRQAYFIAMGLFVVGTVIAAAALTFPMLLIGRVVQASGTAVMMPLLMTTILQLIPPHRRGQVMGVVMIVISVAPALGPTVSGIILQNLSWRFIFIVVLPIAAAMMAIAAVKLVNVNHGEPAKLDLLSVPLTIVGFGGFVYGVSSISEGAGSASLWIALVLGIAGLGLFVWRQLVLARTGEPFLDLRVFTHRTFAVALGIMMIAFGVLIGVATIWPMYLERVHLLEKVTIGLLLLPGGLAMGLLGPYIGRLHDRYGPRVLTLPGSVSLVAVIFLMSRVDGDTPLPILLALHVALSLSLAFVFTPLFTAGLNALPRELYPHGTATLSSLQQVAGGAGTALLVALMSATAATAVDGGATATAALQTGVRTAFIAAAVMALSAVVLALLLPKGRLHVAAEEDADEVLASMH